MLDVVQISPTTWLPQGAPIKNLDSIVWTERHLNHSEFVITSYAVEETLAALPLESVIAERGSPEVMMVEKHSITLDSEGFELLTVSGKSLTSFLRHRTIGKVRGEKYLTSLDESNLVTALIIIYQCLVSDTNWDYTIEAASSYKKIYDGIANATATDSTFQLAFDDDGPDSERYLAAGLAEPAVMNLLSETWNYGFRVARPPYSSYEFVPDTLGFWDVDFVSSNPKLCFDVTYGLPKHADQDTYTVVVLDTELDDLALPSYVKTVEDFKNESHILLETKSVFAHNTEQVPSTTSGIYRRVKSVDGGTPEAGEVAATWEADAIKKAKDDLTYHKKMEMVDGKVSPQARVVYGTDYNLGDIVSVRGKYIPMVQAQVVEYIRSQTQEGFEAYPALIYV